MLYHTASYVQYEKRIVFRYRVTNCTARDQRRRVVEFRFPLGPVGKILLLLVLRPVREVAASRRAKLSSGSRDSRLPDAGPGSDGSRGRTRLTTADARTGQTGRRESARKRGGTRANPELELEDGKTSSERKDRAKKIPP